MLDSKLRTTTVGEILKEERERHRLPLEELSKRTRIRLEYLKALERNHFEGLPAATFVKGYIKTYAKLFGFDFEPLFALLRRDYKESAKGQLVPREFIKPILKKRPLWQPVTVVVALLVVAFLTLFGYVGVQWYNLTKPPALEIISPKSDAFVAAKVVVAGQTHPDVIVTINAQPVALQLDGSFETEILLPREGVNTISVEAVDRRGKKTLQQRTVRVQY